MNILEQFKNHLLYEKKSSLSTVKNYLADIRKFIRWFEFKYHTDFNPNAVNASLIAEYKQKIIETESSEKSLKRYMASLNGFFTFLKSKGVITVNPLENRTTGQLEIDKWLLKQFKQYLYRQDLNTISIKNYLNDIRQFMTWIHTVTNGPQDIETGQGDIQFSQINSQALSEYKNRLLQANMSPVSVNRKLSSLRRYIRWLKEKEVIQDEIEVIPLPISTYIKSATQEQKQQVAPQVLNIHTQTISKDAAKQHAYSRFGPLRLLQKTNFFINSSVDLLIISPLASLVLGTNYIYWKSTGKHLFAPLEIVIEKTTGLSISTTKPDISKPIHPTDKLLTTLDKLLLKRKKVNSLVPQSIAKSMYAPLKISTSELNFKNKLLYHLKHTRPAWYTKYHSYAFAHYLHFGVLFLCATLIGLFAYQTFIGLHVQKSILGINASPPRMLTFQGRLSDAQGAPISTATPLRFSIYNNPIGSGSALLWQEMQVVSPDQKGFFTVSLGSSRPLSKNIFTDFGAIYLGVTIRNNNELTPRQQIANVSLSGNTERLQGMKPITESGAGTRNVVLALDSSGNLTIAGNANPAFTATGGQFTLSGKILALQTNPGSNSNIQLIPDGSGLIDLQKPLQNTTNYSTIPGANGAVEVDDLLAISATSSGQSAFIINQNSIGPLISASTAGIAKFTVDYLGSGTFANDLTVNGDNLITQSPTFNLINTGAINLNIGGAASAIAIGSTSGETTINNILNTKALANFSAGANIPTGQTLTIAGTLNSNLIPNSDNNFSLGSPTNRWANAYINNLFTSPTATSFGFWQRAANALSPSTANDNLIIGNNSMNDNGTIGVGTTNPQAALDVRAVSDQLPIASISGNSSKAGLIVDNTASGDIFAASHAGINRFVISSAGNVGIGDTTPLNTLKVLGSVCVNSVTGGCSGSTPGTIYAANTSLQSADLAENYISAQELKPGDLVATEGLGNNQAIVKTNLAYQANTLGVISTNPAITLNSEAKIDSTHPHLYPLALEGRVPVTVSTINGNIRTGDLLTTSMLPGIAMKATKAGFVIGKALEDFTCSSALNSPNSTDCRGSLMAFINLSWFDPGVQLTDTGDLNIIQSTNGSYQISDEAGSLLTKSGAFASAIAGTINTGFMQAQAIATDSLKVSSDNILVGSLSLRDYIAAIVRDVISQEFGSLKTTVAELSSPSIISPIAAATSLQTNVISPLASDSAIAVRFDNGKLSILNSRLSTSSAVTVFDNKGNASFSGTLQAAAYSGDNASFSGTLRTGRIIADQIDGLDEKLATLAAGLAQQKQNSTSQVTPTPLIYNSIGSQGSSDSASINPPPPSSPTGAGIPVTFSSASNEAELGRDTPGTLDSFMNPASLSAQLSETTPFKADFGQFNQALTVLGSTSLADVSVAGQLSIGGSLILSENTINSLGSDLLLQPLRQGNLQIMGGLISIDTDGNLNVSGNATFAKDVAINGTLSAHIIAPVPDSDLILQLRDNIKNDNNGHRHPSALVIQSATGSSILQINQLGDLIASGAGSFNKLTAKAFNIIRGAQADTSMTQTVASGSAGTATITAYETERTILSPYVTQSSLIYISATSDTQGQTPYIARQTAPDSNNSIPGSFTIEIPNPITKDITLNWWIVN